MTALPNPDSAPGRGLIVGVDATRNRSGGAIAHIKGLMSGDDPRRHGISTVHFWAHDTLLDEVAEARWLVKHRVTQTQGTVLGQMAWQARTLPVLARDQGVMAMFNTDAGSVCPFLPAVTLSQDMLSFEPGEISRYPWHTKARIRLELLRLIQLRRLRKSSVALFLTAYARDVISAQGNIRNTAVIPHGIDTRFFSAAAGRRPFPQEGVVRCLYVSNAAPYKHQWQVVEAIARLRAETATDIRLRLVGGGKGAAMQRLQAAIARHDPDGRFVEQVAFVPNARIIDELRAADLFIFASSCENMPITLLEAMAAGLPIATSDRGPMPEVMGPQGVYFDPERPQCIAAAIQRLIASPELREANVAAALELAQQYTWPRCAAETWQLLATIAGTPQS